MTNKEAIDNLEKYIDLILNKNYCDCNELNVISNGGYCDGSKNVAVAIKHLIKRCKELEQIEEAHHKLNGELREELQLKDKMIDLMVQEILNYDNQFVISFFKNKEHAKEYFTKKASEKDE